MKGSQLSGGTRTPHWYAAFGVRVLPVTPGADPYPGGQQVTWSLPFIRDTWSSSSLFGPGLAWHLDSGTAEGRHVSSSLLLCLSNK